MSQMPTSVPPGGMMIDDEPKTSLAAIIGFVISLVGCCLPTGVLGVVLGIFGLIGIGRSGGRVGGKGLAIAAIIIGVINTAIWIGALSMGVMGGRYVNAMGAEIGTVMTSIDDGNYDGARALLIGPNASVSDEALAQFGAAVNAEYGSFVSPPESLVEMFSWYLAVGQAIQPYQGQNDLIPIPARFEKGQVLMIYGTDPTGNSGPGANFEVPLLNIIIVGQGGTAYELSDFAAQFPTTPTTPASGSSTDPIDSEAGDDEPDAEASPDEDGP